MLVLVASAWIKPHGRHESSDLSVSQDFPHMQIIINFIKTPILDHCRVLYPNSWGGSNWYQRQGRLVDLAVSKLFSLSCLLCLLLLSLIFQQTMIQSCRIFRS